MPRVSVITPAHNAEASLAETLGSVQAQTFGDWEAIVADDASDDATTAVAIGSGDPRISAVVSAGNLGPAGARNLALERASGELIALLDADDRWLPQYLDVMVRLYDDAQARFGNVGIVACDAWMEGPGGREAASYRDRFGFPQTVDVTALLHSNPIFVSALCPRRIVEDVGRFSTECFGSEDHDLWLRVVEAGYRVVATRERLVVYRLSGTGISANPLAMARTNEATYRRALNRGRLTAGQRRIARRGLRVARAAGALESMTAARRRSGKMPWAQLARATPVIAGAILSWPQRWPRWTRQAMRSWRRQV